ncbi:MAG TPA: hypothetical protein ENI23_17610 [bacterium]|nr:hypothetical protein [bacterium]
MTILDKAPRLGEEHQSTPDSKLMPRIGSTKETISIMPDLGWAELVEIITSGNTRERKVSGVGSIHALYISPEDLGSNLAEALTNLKNTRAELLGSLVVPQGVRILWRKPTRRRPVEEMYVAAGYLSSKPRVLKYDGNQKYVGFVGLTLTKDEPTGMATVSPLPDIDTYAVWRWERMAKIADSMNNDTDSRHPKVFIELSPVYQKELLQLILKNIRPEEDYRELFSYIMDRFELYEESTFTGRFVGSSINSEDFGRVASVIDHYGMVPAGLYLHGVDMNKRYWTMNGFDIDGRQGELCGISICMRNEEGKIFDISIDLRKYGGRFMTQVVWRYPNGFYGPSAGIQEEVSNAIQSNLQDLAGQRLLFPFIRDLVVAMQGGEGRESMVQ